MYTAKDPTVNGIGFAAVRDFNAFLRYATKDDAGTANPMAGDILRVYTEISSQPGRLLNDFRNLGFNQAENGQKVFDGHMQWIAAADGINMNLRFSQPGRTERNRQDHLYAEGVFPFANESTTDHITGQDRGPLRQVHGYQHLPVGMEIWSGNEYWVKAASLVYHRHQGHRRPARASADAVLLHVEHAARHRQRQRQGQLPAVPESAGFEPVQRALFIALDDWVTRGDRAAGEPSSASCQRHARARRCRRSGVGFPTIPGVTYNGLKTTRYRFNYGPRFDQGIMDLNPPTVVPSYQDNPLNGPIYPSYVPTTDADGNDIEGVRLPDVRVPLNTYYGMGAARGGSGRERRLRKLRAKNSVPGHESGTHGVRRSAAVDRRALSDVPRLLLQSVAGDQ